ncbi:hypothetical protein BST33_00925 [Mycolicibacter minnesotensis]|uniref:Low molecular weight antigen MTB12-like C-terminal domain-containing protein n=1 Tax=Mycolicibacter minnesotensis TaxID=1118379 RepID=A0A7I7R8S4_9MYCO|nr:hypothetical protein [Mycolicibacter minnesotensis]ORB04487.1 hypothetical protein BST33_00925 [Mycolicibacter minnesotensis]BBY35084.1 low molecular weight antigen MTB12 [Mycolicibacter minnesotensis]
MTGKLLLIGAAALTAIGVATGGVASAEPAAPQDSVLDAPIPQEPAPPAPAGAPLPTTGEVAGMLTRLSDAGIGYKEKADLVENGITQHEGHGLDSELRRAYRDGELPYNFDVLNVVQTGEGHGLANVTITGPKMPAPQTVPLQLVDQGSWVLSHDSATQLMQILGAH